MHKNMVKHINFKSTLYGLLFNNFYWINLTLLKFVFIPLVTWGIPHLIGPNPLVTWGIPHLIGPNIDM